MARFEHSREGNSRDSRRGSSNRNTRGGDSRGDSRRGSSNRNTHSRSFEDGPRRNNRRDSDREPKRYSSRNRRDFQMTKVTCSSCGADCEVPFKPTSNKPVYCDKCFAGKDKASSFAKPSNHSNKDLDIINEKLNKIMKALDIE